MWLYGKASGWRWGGVMAVNVDMGAKLLFPGYELLIKGCGYDCVTYCVPIVC